MVGWLEWSVSGMLRCQRRRCSERLWVHREESWRRNITTSRTSFCQRRWASASLWWLGQSTGLCCHTVVISFNYMLKRTPAATETYRRQVQSGHYLSLCIFLRFLCFILCQSVFEFLEKRYISVMYYYYYYLNVLFSQLNSAHCTL